MVSFARRARGHAGPTPDVGLNVLAAGTHVDELDGVRLLRAVVDASVTGRAPARRRPVLRSPFDADRRSACSTVPAIMGSLS